MPPSALSSAGVVATVVLAGCAWNLDSSSVTFRDSSRISVWQQDKSGALHQVVPEGGSSDAVVHTFSNLVGPDEHVHIWRESSGAIRLAVPDGIWGRPEPTLVDRDGRMAPQPWFFRIFVNSETLRSSGVYVPFEEPISPRSSLNGYALSSWDNIVEVRARSGPWAPAPASTLVLVFGTTALAIGAGLLAWGLGAGASPGHDVQPAEVALGLPIAGLGVTLDTWALWQLLARSREEMVYP